VSDPGCEEGRVTELGSGEFGGREVVLVRYIFAGVDVDYNDAAAVRGAETGQDFPLVDREAALDDVI
jgi:hypothetical protein